MKIIKPGRQQRGWSVEADCTGRGNGGGGCGAFLLVEHADLFAIYSHARNETDAFATFKCEQCGVLSDLFSPPSSIWPLPSRAEWEAARTTKKEQP